MQALTFSSEKLGWTSFISRRFTATNASNERCSEAFLAPQRPWLLQQAMATRPPLTLALLLRRFLLAGGARPSMADSISAASSSSAGTAALVSVSAASMAASVETQTHQTGNQRGRCKPEVCSPHQGRVGQQVLPASNPPHETAWQPASLSTHPAAQMHPQPACESGRRTAAAASRTACEARKQRCQTCPPAAGIGSRE